MRAERTTGEWSLGWRTVVAGLIGMTIVNIHSATIGMLVQPLNEAFGWSRAQASSGILIITSVMFVALPVVGMLLRHIDAWRLATGGLLLFCATMVGVGFSGPSVWTWYLAWAVVGLAYSTCSTLVWTTIVSRSFAVNRGVALSITVSGVGVATVIATLVGAYMLERFGWRAVYFALAGVGLFLLLVLQFVRGKPDGVAGTTGEARVTPVQATGPEAREVLTSFRYWRFVLAQVLTSLGVSVTFYHFQAMLHDGGLTPMQAASLAALSGPSVLIGRLTGGFLLDHLPPRLIGTVFFALPAIPAFLMIDYSGSLERAAAAAIIVGVSLGVEGDVSAYLTSRYFGLRSYSIAFAVMSSFSAIMFGVGPVVAGAVFDAFGSYGPMLQVLIVVLLLSGVMIATLGRAPALEAPVERRPES
jgi:MFS family permease